MFRNSTRILVPAIIALTVCAGLSSTDVFAKGGTNGSKGKPGMGREHHDRDHFRRERYDRYWDRFCFGYPCYGCVEAPVCSCEVVTPQVVVQPVVAETPVCTTCEPSYVYGAGWGYRHDRRDFRHRERPLEKDGKMGGHGKK
jgi:hypothetical protein